MIYARHFSISNRYSACSSLVRPATKCVSQQNAYTLSVFLLHLIDNNLEPKLTSEI